MIILGVVLILLGCWLLPAYVPEFPYALDHIGCVIGWILLVVGIILWVLGAAGRPLGGRRHYW